MKKYSTSPLISIVMACYNGEQFIAEQIESIINQDYRNLEVIIVDDASTDNTKRIVESFAKKDSRIKIYYNKYNIGYIKNFERGLRLSKGAFVALSDQDDIWFPEKISMLFNTIANHPIVYSNSVLIDEKGNNLNKNLSGIKRLVDFNSCLSYAIGGSVPGHAMLICRELIEKCYPFPEIIPHDYWIGFIASCYGTIKYIDTPLNAYRQHKNNTFGVSTGKNVSVKKKSAKENLNEIRNRMQLLSESCPKDLSEKKIYQQLNATYNSFGVVNNFKRAYLFFTNRRVILAYKKKSDFRKWLFCFKTFFKPQ